jgi:hypothetical protein
MLNLLILVNGKNGAKHSDKHTQKISYETLTCAHASQRGEHFSGGTTGFA